MSKLTSGDKAPKFSLPDQSNRTVKLADFKGQKVLLYFYPKANTPGCTTQSVEVQAALPQLKTHETVAIGISPDAPAAQHKFATNQGLDFSLLSDPDHAVADAYGVWGEKSMYGKKYMGIVRSAFLIDEAGKISKAWYGISPKKTIPEAIKALAGS